MGASQVAAFGGWRAASRHGDVAAVVLAPRRAPRQPVARPPREREDDDAADVAIEARGRVQARRVDAESAGDDGDERVRRAGVVGDGGDAGGLVGGDEVPGLRPG